MKTTIIALELKRTLRTPEVPLFIVGLPTLMFVIFGVASPWGKFDLGNNGANWAFAIMVNLAAYGAIIANTSMSASAALERLQGWGRQIAITPLRDTSYVAMKALVGMAVTVLPVAVIFAIGAATKAVAKPEAWVAAVVVLLLGSLTFTFYGMGLALLLRSDMAVSIASSSTVLFGFGATMFMQLSGWMLKVAPFVPGYGYVVLARYAAAGGAYMDADGRDYTDSLGVAVVNLVGWAVLFAVFALLVLRTSRGRR
ncbi:ABC transporter permease [Mobiluncus mulieris]|uniref:ABC transporter permease n=1 Tax=Mobiluncus mulieris TaxID=2052 RepID=UPI00242CF258|nr:ABC transporter permease [Mobiluncus mulieris]